MTTNTFITSPSLKLRRHRRDNNAQNDPSDDRANQQNSFAKTFGDLQGDGLPAQSLLDRSGLRDDGGLLDMRGLSRRQIAGIGQSGSGYADFRTNSIAIEIESAADTGDAPDFVEVGE